MDTEVIRSFLVSVGVDVDEKGLKRFKNSVEDITKVTKEFAEVMAAAAVAASVAIVKVSEQFEDLYYASQRLRSSVENIKAFSFGVQQMGGNAQAARQSMEAFASFLRSNPAGASIVRGFFGVDASDGDAAAALEKIGKSAREMQARGVPYWAIQQRAAMVGIDENTLQALLRNTDEWSKKFRDLVDANKVNMDRLAQTSVNLMNSFRFLGAEIEVHFAAILAKIDPQVLQLGVTIAAVGGVLEVIALVAGGAAAEFVALGAAVVLLADDFNAWKNGGGAIDWGPFADSIDEVTASIRSVIDALADLSDALAPVLKWWIGAIGPAVSLMLVSVSTLLHLIADAIRVIAALLHGDMPNAWAAFKKGGIDAMSGIHAAGSKLVPLMHAIMGHPDKAAPKGASAQARARAVAANSNTPAQRASVGSAMAYFMSQGWTAEQAAGIVANLNAESGMNANAIGDGGSARGMAQWHPDRQANFAKFAGHDLNQSTVAEQLAFVNYELTKGKYANIGAALRKTTGAADAGALVSSRYESPANRLGEMALRGQAAQGILAGQRLAGDGAARAVTIHQKTDINVSGSGTPHDTAKAVGDSVNQANSTLVRNTQAVMR